MDSTALIEISSSDNLGHTIGISKGELVYLENSEKARQYLGRLLGTSAHKQLRISVENKDLEQYSSANWVTLRRRIAYINQDLRLLTEATVQENIDFYLSSINANASSNLSWLMKEFKLNSSVAVSKLSDMERYKLRLIIGLAKEPDILILDNPYAQLEVQAYESVMNKVYQLLMEKGITCISILSNSDLISSFPGRQLDLT